MYKLFRECRRVLKPKGYLLVLNEIPINDLNYLYMLLKQCFKLIINVIIKKDYEYDFLLSTRGFMNNPYLGDNVHSNYQWQAAITASFDKFRVIESNLHPNIKNPIKNLKIKHFLCWNQDKASS